MAEMEPPRFKIHPMRVIFMISKEPPPTLAEAEKWSPTFHNFLEQALLQVQTQKPTQFMLKFK